jgi:hypothetical protein
VTDLAQFCTFFGIYMSKQTLLDIVHECVGYLFEDKLTRTSGSKKSLRCSTKQLRKNWRGAVTNFARFLRRMLMDLSAPTLAVAKFAMGERYTI